MKRALRSRSWAERNPVQIELARLIRRLLQKLQQFGFETGIRNAQFNAIRQFDLSEIIVYGHNGLGWRQYASAFFVLLGRLQAVQSTFRSPLSEQFPFAPRVMFFELAPELFPAKSGYSCHRLLKGELPPSPPN
jgi:hypothetical protein